MFTLNELFGKAPDERKNLVGHFGPAVLGEEEAAAEAKLAEMVEADVLTFGPLVTGRTDGPAPTAPTAPTDAIVVRSVADLKTALAEHPEASDALIDQEFARESGPRKGALRLFLEAEKKQTSPRQAVVTRLNGALAG